MVLTQVAAELAPPRAFDEACRMVVDYLATTVPMGFWGVSRVVGERQTMLVTSGSAYGGLGSGTEIAWATSLCRTMSCGETPRVVADTREVPALAEAVGAADSMSVRIGSYVGTPIVQADGELFGTVVGLDPEPHAVDRLRHEALLDLLSSLLSSVLEADSASVEVARELERATSEAETDALTGLLNRRGWVRWLAREEERFRRFGDPASVFMLDLDGLKAVNDTHGHDAGDRYIRHTADTLRATVRGSDALARLGGDEFALVAFVGVDAAGPLADRLQAALLDAGVPCSIGVAPFRLGAGFSTACCEADSAMYENKRLRKTVRGAYPVVRGSDTPLTEVPRPR